MIIARTPFRISFFGGGTDYPVWYREHPGAVLVTTINKYCYISCRYLPPFFEYKSRIIWSQIENVKSVDEIRHPAVRGVLKHLKITEGIELHHDGDLPARTGLGSSSAFTVGLLQGLYALRGVMPDKMRLAHEAIEVEQRVLKENVGVQDQIIAAIGGFKRLDFEGDHQFQVTPIILPESRLKALQDHLLLVFTGISRTASEIADQQVKNTPRKTSELSRMYEMVSEAIRLLSGHASLDEFGKLMHESWTLKKSLSDRVSTSEVDQLYEMARSAGATGGKLLGAGGGGFFLVFVKPELRARVSERLKGLLQVPFRFETSGSQIIFHEADHV